MKAFAVGLVFLLAVFVLGAVGIILSPFLLVLAWFLRWLVILLLLIFAIWLLGRLIIFVWEKMLR